MFRNFSGIEAVWAVLLCLAFVPLAADAQVSASLVAADTSIQPGRALTVAVRLDHEPHWHTYWINAGTGYPTTLEWHLPQGWSAGQIQWPTPIAIKNDKGEITGNGYDGVLYLPVTLTPPGNLRAGKEVKLDMRASWLMCADICIPDRAALSLTLPVALDAPKPDAAVRRELAKLSIPEPAPDGQSVQRWQIAASRAAQTVTLQVAAAQKNATAGADALKSLRFFSEDGFIQYDQAQPRMSSVGKTRLTLSIDKDAASSTQRLVGVLAYTDPSSGVYRGIKVDIPFVSAASLSPAADSAEVWTAVDSTDAMVSSGFLATLALALIGGLILNLMPCVFPVLGIKVLGFVDQAGSNRRHVTLHGLTFTAGVLLSFWALALALDILRAGGEQLGWGFQLQSPEFVFCVAVVMLIFALNLSGVFEFGLSAMSVGSTLQMKDGYTGSFFTGVLATVVATPCSAPFLAPALGAALALPTLQSFLVFTAIALGLSLPYLLLAIFPQALRRLPKPGRWMETFKQAMAFALYATMGWLVWVLAGQTGESELLTSILGLTLIAMAVWLYGRYQTSGASAHARLGLLGGVALLAFGMHLGWPRTAVATDLMWEPWSPQRITQLREAGRPVYVDFTARWCATCQTNKRVVFGSEKVRRYVRDHKVALLKADWTTADAAITAELARWQRSAVPFNLVYRLGRLDPKVLPEILTPGLVLDAFNDER